MKSLFDNIENWFNETFGWFFTNGMKAQQEEESNS
jgi:hypothetical protein